MIVTAAIAFVFIAARVKRLRELLPRPFVCKSVSIG